MQHMYLLMAILDEGSVALYSYLESVSLPATILLLTKKFTKYNIKVESVGLWASLAISLTRSVQQQIS